jgi:hypothetical protein
MILVDDTGRAPTPASGGAILAIPEALYPSFGSGSVSRHRRDRRPTPPSTSA